jgi:hypothetical protein
MNLVYLKITHYYLIQVYIIFSAIVFKLLFKYFSEHGHVAYWQFLQNNLPYYILIINFIKRFFNTG